MKLNKFKRKIYKGLFLFLPLLSIFLPRIVLAKENNMTHEAEMHLFVITFALIAILLIMGKFFGSISKRLGQPVVLGELFAGIVLGNLAFFGFNLFRDLEHNILVAFFSQLGVLILLFQIGLESNLADLKKVGYKAVGVAILGIIVPYFLGAFFIGPLLLPGLSNLTYAFLGAALTATSVGITGRVLKDMKQLNREESKIILSAAVIDDILGILILAMVSAVAMSGKISIANMSLIAFKAFLFLVLGIVLGKVLAPHISNLFSKIYEGRGMKFTLSISICFFFAYIAYIAGLEPIIGAFIAGLILDPVHFKRFKNYSMVKDIEKWLKESEVKKENSKKIKNILEKHSHHHVEELIKNLSYFFVPIFFVYTGLQVKIESFLSLKVLGLALIITVVAVLGKAVSGLFLKKPLNKFLVGFGMVPRGEVGLIFANVGRGFGLINDEVFSIIIIMVILTTLVTPIILTRIINKIDKAN